MRCRSPVSRLNRVLLPVLGFPAIAIRGRPTVAGRGRTGAEEWHSEAEQRGLLNLPRLEGLLFPFQGDQLTLQLLGFVIELGERVTLLILFDLQRRQVAIAGLKLSG